MKKKIKVAVTGGIGGGKSSFCSYLTGKGFTVLSADEISKEILVKNVKIKKEVIQTFGTEIYNNGRLNASVLAAKVFNNPGSLKKLNSIVHPEVISELNRLMKVELRTKTVVFVEAALIYEAKMEEMFDYIILITANDELKKKRLKEKGMSEEEYIRRSLAQIPDEKKARKADFVFENNNDVSELYNKADIFIKLTGAA